MALPLYRYGAQVLRWVDGDTVDLRVDLGFHTWIETRFRLVGVNTPERGQPGATEAKTFCAFHAPVGADVEIETRKAADKYGRWLVIIHTKGEESTLNTMLLTHGLALPFMV